MSPAPCTIAVLFTTLALGVGCGARAPEAVEPRPEAEGPATCGGLERIALAPEPTPVLADHLRLRPISGLAARARPRSIMAAPDPDSIETRLVLDRENGSAALLVTELFRRAGADFEAEVRAWLGDPETDVRPLETAAPLRALLVTPPRVAAPERPGQLVMVARVIVASPDDTLQHLALFLDERTLARGHDGCGALAARIAETLTPGERLLAGTGERVALSGETTLELPRGHALVAQPGPDFTVFYVYPLRELTAPHAQLGIYLGHDPSSHADDAIDLRSLPGAIFGRSVEWRSWTTAAGGGRRLHHQELLTDVPGASGLTAHLFLVAEDATAAAELQHIAETMAVVAEGGGG